MLSYTVKITRLILRAHYKQCSQAKERKKKLQLLNESVNLLVEKLIVWFKRLKCEV